MDTLREANRDFFDGLWRSAELSRPERFNTWPVVSRAAAAGPCLELGPGLRPRLPLDHAWFLEGSRPAAGKLAASGARALVGDVSALPFPESAFSLVGAFDIVEHVADDGRVFSEIGRVLRKGGTLVLSIPLHAAWWTPFDDLVGHYRRYDPPDLLRILDAHGLVLEKSAVYGMQPRNRRLMDLGNWMLRTNRQRAMWWYNRVLLPLGIFFQRPLRFEAGLNAPAGVDEIIAVCRRI